MVVKLIGNVNGNAVVFSKTSNRDEWEATVPSALNGVYVIDMMAFDEAGNFTYWAKYVLTIDLQSLYVNLYKYPYYTELKINKYEAEILSEKYYATILESGYVANDVCKF